jgi:hypothetical protein
MQAVAERSSASPRVLVFRTRMAAPDTTPPQLPNPPGFHPPTHGNWAQWGGIVVALIIPFVLRYIDRTATQDAETFNLKVDKRIDDKLNPAIDRVNGHIDTKVDELSRKIDALSDRVSRIEGRLDKRVSSLERRADQQTSLAKLIDPNRVLATIRLEIQMAQNSGKALPASDLADYKNVVQALPISAHEYWTTVAAIINYQSLINQMSGEAPDPNKVSRPCVRSVASVFIGGEYANCVVDLDTNAFDRVMFKDSVIRYQGGTVSLRNVQFVNCRFDLKLTSTPQTPAQNQFLLALLESLDQKSIKVSTH